MRTPGIIDPGSFIESGRLDDKRGIVLPLADRIAVPSWLRNILRGKPSPVRPDAAKCPIILIKDQHLLFSLKDLYRSEVKEFYARNPIGSQISNGSLLSVMGTSVVPNPGL